MHRHTNDDYFVSQVYMADSHWSRVFILKTFNINKKELTEMAALNFYRFVNGI